MSAELYGLRLAAILHERGLSVRGLAGLIKDSPGQGTAARSSNGQKARRPVESTVGLIIRGQSRATLKTVQAIAIALDEGDDPWLADAFDGLVSRTARRQSAESEEFASQGEEPSSAKEPRNSEQINVIAAVTARQAGPSYSSSDLVVLSWLVKAVGLPELEWPDLES